MAAQSTLKNMMLCLTAVCFVCAAVLGGVFVLTKAPIEAAAQKALTESISVVLPDGGELSQAQSSDMQGIDEYYSYTQAGKVLAYAVKTSTNGFGGTLTLMVGVLPDGTVYNTSVLAHSETPGLGAKCTSDEAFTSQWQGFNGTLKVKQDGGDVDAITASTITSRAYTLAVAQAVNLAKSLGGMSIDEDAVSGASAITGEE